MNYFNQLALLIRSTIRILSFSGYSNFYVFSLLISSALLVSFLELFSISLVVAVLFRGEELTPYINYLNVFFSDLGFVLSDFQILILIIVVRFFIGLSCPIGITILIARIARNLSKKVFLTSLSFDIHAFSKSNAVKQMRLVSGGVNIFCSTYLQAASGFIIEIVTIIFLLIGLIMILPNYFLSLLSVLFIATILLVIITVKIIFNISEKKKQQEENKNRIIVDTQSMYREIKSLKVTPWFVKQFDLFNQKVLKYHVHIFSINISLRGIIEFLSILFILFVFLIAGDGKTIDPSSSIVFGILAFLRMYPSINRCVSHSGSISHSIPFTLELDTYITKAVPTFERQMRLENQPIIRKFKSIHIKNFSFNLENKLLGPFDLKINAGDWVRVKGITGVGKSSLLDVLVKFWKPQIATGKILIYPDTGLPTLLEDANLDFTYVPQFTHLIEGSIYENLKLGRDFNKSQLDVLLDIVCFPSSMKIDRNSVDCRVLSGGEKQRLCIARALSIVTDLLILDEGFSAIDKVTAKKIIKNIKKTFPTLTVIYTFHGSVEFD